MTNRERVIASLNHRQPDRCPYVIEFTQKAKAVMEAAYGDSYLPLIDSAIHKVTATLGPRAQWLSETVYQDEWGVQWDRSLDPDIGNVCNRVLPERNLSGFAPPDPWAPDKFATMAEQIATGQGKFIRLSIAFTLFERAWSLRGMENLMLDMMEAPAFVDELLDAICEYNLALIEQAVRFPIDAVHFPDDWGDQRGVMMGPRLWERFLQPCVQRMFDAAKQGGKFVSIHCCGKVQELFPRLIEMGLDLFNPFQPEVMDPFEMKTMYGDRLSFWGGVSTQRLLPFGTPEQVRTEARRLMRQVGRDGGYVISPAHQIPGDARPENVMALIETVNE
ncbi:MAG: uroporphyrinogen decarboxylase family protein [Armatimonadetes bacterium]|nr:uroporphyrinogen decarboxylase family protein [Armatimonadota bacterium]